MNSLKFANNEKDNAFFTSLRKKVNMYFKENEVAKTANKKAFIKAILLFTLYFSLYLSILFAGSKDLLLMFYILSGITTIFLALNVAHDAAHGIFSQSKAVNSFLLNTFDLLGANGYLWKLKHVHSHHPHVNIPNMDGDIKQSNLVRIFPNAQFLNFHKYQFVYMPVLYLFYTIVWLLIRDFRDFMAPDISGKPGLKHPKKEVFKLIVSKSLFIFRMVILPYWLLPFGLGTILLGFLLFNFAASATVAMALISAHVGEESVYPSPDADGKMETSWVRHQIITTVDFATNNKLLSHLFGGFNHHVVHHLFPNICHIHYPVLTEILKETCVEYNMPYKSNPSLYQAMMSHFRFLKMRSQQGLRVEYIDM